MLTPLLIPVAAKQPKGTIPLFTITKSVGYDIFYNVFYVGGTQHVIVIAATKVTHSNVQLQSKQLGAYYTGSDAKTHKTSSPNLSASSG